MYLRLSIKAQRGRNPHSAALKSHYDVDILYRYICWDTAAGICSFDSNAFYFYSKLRSKYSGLRS